MFLFPCNLFEQTLAPGSIFPESIYLEILLFRFAEKVIFTMRLVATKVRHGIRYKARPKFSVSLLWLIVWCDKSIDKELAVMRYTLYFSYIDTLLDDGMICQHDTSLCIWSLHKHCLAGRHIGHATDTFSFGIAVLGRWKHGQHSVTITKTPGWKISSVAEYCLYSVRYLTVKKALSGIRKEERGHHDYEFMT